MKYCCFFISILFQFSFLQGLSQSSYVQNSDYSLAADLIWKPYFQQRDTLAMRLADSLASSDGITSLYFENIRGFLILKRGILDSSVSVQTSVLRQAAEYDQELLYFRTHYFLAEIKKATGDYEGSADLILEALSYFLSLDEVDSAFAGRLYQSLAHLYGLQGKSDEAFAALKNSDDFFYMNSDIHQTTNPVVRGDLYAKMNLHQKSLESYETALDLFEEKKRIRDKVELFTKLSGQYLMVEDLPSAKLYMDKALNLAMSTGNGSDLFTAFSNAASVLKSEGRYKEALGFIEMRDSVSAKEVKSSYTEKTAFANRQMDQQLREVDFLNLEQQIEDKQESINRQRILIFIIILICFYLLGSVIVFRRLVLQKNKSQGMLSEKDAQLQQKSAEVDEAQDRLIQSEKLALLGRISAGIAHELNTPVGAMKANLELIDDVQKREIELYRSLSASISKEDFDIIIKLIFAGTKNADKIVSKEEEASIRKMWDKLLKDLNNDVTADLIELAVELKLDYKIERYLPLCHHKNAVSLFEFALYVTNRYQSIQTALEATKRVQKILGSFKTYSFKQGWESYEKLDLKNSLHSIISLHQNILRKIDLLFEVGDGLELFGIPDEISQVWTNIISNAAYAMDYRGQLKITGERLNDQIAIEFEDTGGGIHMEDPERVFDPFFTTKPQGEGSGLGLDISRQIIHKHNGSISFENTSDGVKFVVILPSGSSQISA